MKVTAKKVLITVGVAGLAYWIWKNTQKVHEEIENLDENNKEALRDAGFPEEVVQGITDLPEEEETNLPRQIFEKLRFESSVLPTDAVDTDYIFDGNGENIVHITQKWDKRLKREYLTFFFRIPEAVLPAKGRKTAPDSRDILRAIKGTWDASEQKLVGPCFADRIKSIIHSELAKNNIVPAKTKDLFAADPSIEGYAFIQYEDSKSGDKVSMPILLTRNIYRNNVFNSEHERVTDYIDDLLNEIDSSNEGYWETDSLAYTHDKMGNKVPATVKVFGGMAGVEVKILLQDKYNLDGINADMAIKIIEEIYNEELKIESRNGSMTYDKFLFHSIDSKCCVYTTEPSDKDGKLRVVIQEMPEFEGWECEN